MDIGVFTERLRKLRGERSQREVAEGIGITQQTYGRYENGARKPDLEIIEAMARYHEVSADYLLGLNEDPTPDYDMQIAVRITGLSQATIEHIQNLYRPPMPPEARPLLNMIIQHIPYSLISDTIRAHDAAIKAYEMRKILLRKYCKENNVRIPEELLTTHGYNRARAQTHMLAREIEDFEEYLKIALAMYYEKVWNGKEVDSEDSDAPFTIQSLEYAKLLLDLPSLLQSRLEQDVMMSAHSLGDILADHDEFLNEQTKQELQAVCDGLLKLKGESVWQALINVEIPIE